MRIGFTRKTQIKQKVPYVSFPSLEWGEVHVHTKARKAHS